MKCCRGLVCRRKFCRGSYLCIHWENKNLYIELCAQFSERFKSCSDNQCSKSSLIHLTVSQWRDQGADGSIAWYISLGPVFSNKIKCFWEYKTYCTPLDVADQKMSPFSGQKSTFTSWVWLKLKKAWQQCFFKGSFPLWAFLCLQIVEHIPAISTEHYFLGTEASVGLNQDPAAHILLSKLNHRATRYITGVRTKRKQFFMRCFSSETSFAFILYNGLFFSQRISLSLPVLQMGCRFNVFLFSEVRDHFTSLGSVLFFPCTTSAAVFVAWIVPGLVLKGMFQKCLRGYELLVIVLSSSSFIFIIFIFKIRLKRLLSLKFTGFNSGLG